MLEALESSSNRNCNALDTRNFFDSQKQICHLFWVLKQR